MFQLLKADTRENAIYILECQAGKYLFNIHNKNCVHGKRGSLTFPMFFESECENFTFSLRRAGNQLGGLH